MTRRLGSLLLVVGMLFGTCVWAQTDTGAPDNQAPTQPGPKPAYTYPDATPSLDFLNPALENSSITLGIGAGFRIDSYAYHYNNGNTQDFWLFHVAPSIKIQQFRPESFLERGVCWRIPSLFAVQRSGESKQQPIFTKGRGRIPLADGAAVATCGERQFLLFGQSV